MGCSSCRSAPNAPGRLAPVLALVPHAARLRSNLDRSSCSREKQAKCYGVRTHSIHLECCSLLGEPGGSKCRQLPSLSTQEGALEHTCASSLHRRRLHTTRGHSSSFTPVSISCTQS